MRNIISGVGVFGRQTLFLECLSRILAASDIPVKHSLESMACEPASGWEFVDIVLVVAAGTTVPLNSEETIRNWRETFPKSRLVVIVEAPSVQDALTALRHGASAILVNPNYETLVASLELVMAGQTLLPPDLLALLIGGAADAAPAKISDAGELELEPQRAAPARSDEIRTTHLSARERSIVECLVAGDSNKIIARKHEIAETTVKVHVKAILRKTRARNRTQVAVWAMQHEGEVGPHFISSLRR